MGVPMIDDIELKLVQEIRQETDLDFAHHRLPGLEGTLHQRLGRRSHRVLVSGVLVPESATADLESLQQKAKSGEEVSFTADITTALEVQKMVIETLAVEQRVGGAGQYGYALTLAESPPLPPPAEVSAFGGLDEFGLGDLGFDADALGGVLDDIQNQAAAAMAGLDSALDALEQLEALASLADLADIGSPLRPVTDKVGELGALGPLVGDLGGALGNLTPSED